MSKFDVQPSRFGHVALLGRPNVGKSTLLNALIGADLSIVSPKPQTTRHRILGIATHEHAQIAFLDTPGLHEGGKRAMNRQLNRVARHAPDEADVLLHVIAAPRWTDEDEQVWKLIEQRDIPCLLVINKIDLVKDKADLLPFVESISKRHAYQGIHYLQATRGKGLKALMNDVVRLLPEGQAVYAEDDLTDRSERFLAAEMIREQLMLRLSDELPYATTVEIERFEQDGELARISAAIWVEREGQKAIVIGAGGAQLKAIGSQARRRMETMFGGKVFLQLWVKVRENWSDDDGLLRQLGYMD
ncbi:MAG: GTPase Era [Dokdonella sp.]|uniref:GTPase Era n=1 Tax=Dokdonella sp. TaxID=2291710 RepID=UPI002B67DF33|nr:GTPase Era [Dokdonella sp.]HNV06860.1 GTPase Era [Dokdonella sp.]